LGKAIAMQDVRTSDPFARRGMMLVLSSPSGAGKTTMARRLLADHPEISVSVSVTTRPPRPGEIHGKDYHFISAADFDHMVANEALAEWAHVFGNRYGTPRGPLLEAMAEGRDILFDIDWQGTQQLKRHHGTDLVSIFLLPPNLPELERRLRTRKQDSDAVIASRMAHAAEEIGHWAEYDYVLVNDDPDVCYARISAILSAERTRRTRCAPGLAQFVSDMLRD